MREKRPGVWELRVYLGRDTAGRVRHRSVTFRGGKRPAGRALARLAAEEDLAEGALLLDWGPDTTFNDAVLGWQRNGWQDLSPTTVRRYRSIWKVHVKDGFGRNKIRSTGPYEVEGYLRQLKASGQSEASVRQIRAFLHRACHLARKWSGNRLPNPVSGTDMPEWAFGEQAQPVRSPEPGEVRALLDAARGYDIRLSTFIRVVAATGARRGEVCALRWLDIDWEGGSLLFDEAVVGEEGGARIQGPKIRSSVRRIAVDADTLTELGDLRVDRLRLAAACGVLMTETAFVFSVDTSGVTPPHPDGMTHAFSTVRTRAHIADDVHLHSLRHFQSTRLDPIISEAQKQARLGWATAHMARHYTDSISEEDRRAAEYIGSLLAGQSASSSSTMLESTRLTSPR